MKWGSWVAMKSILDHVALCTWRFQTVFLWKEGFREPFQCMKAISIKFNENSRKLFKLRSDFGKYLNKIFNWSSEHQNLFKINANSRLIMSLLTNLIPSTFQLHAKPNLLALNSSPPWISYHVVTQLHPQKIFHCNIPASITIQCKNK